ncbi:MOSC domain-containing protein [Actinospongicola halichondriae]|uniref:MOSC domain-containing protein n=1 Tax=Actinospongicola halichondriae TaxID=3236844 RepID=UPI003D3B40A8
MGDVCDGCGFTADDYSERDLRKSPQWLASMCDDMVDPVDPVHLEHPSVDELLTRLRSTIASIDADAVDVAAVHAGVHGLRDLSRVLHQVGAGVPTRVGSVVQLSASDGGVPKAAITTAEVGFRGLVGDRQANRKHHGRPFQALCLWSTEVIDALADEGHPIGPGLAGENVTVAGIDWSTLRPGVRLLIGNVTCEISGWAEPCRKNDQWFIGRSDRMDHRLHPGWSRAYAWVLEPGTITTGDPVVVEP